MADVEKSGDDSANAAAVPHANTRVSTDATATAPDPHKDGGLVAWLQVLGAFCVYFNTCQDPDRHSHNRGMLNSFGVFQTYYELDAPALRGQSAFAIGWIGSTQSALFFVATLVVGPMFDLGYFRSLLRVGTALLVISMFLLSVSRQFYQVLLTQSVLFGLGAGCMFLPAPAVVAQHFDARLGLAISIASVDSAAVRVIAFVVLWTSLCILLMKSKTEPAASRNAIDWTAFTDLPYMLLNLGFVFGFMGLYIVITYFQLFALTRTSVPAGLAESLLIIINAGSLVGRVILGYFADVIGFVNMQLAVALVATILIFSLLAVRTPAAVVVIAVLFGITYPIAGAILTGTGDTWLHLILFAGLLLAVSTVILGVSRISKLDGQWMKPL
ncbi:major facilitator superfamily domain-containing protein [Xylariaceae sp. AK1471]|nr:major facilitator superfamily domain-containing protein [Xylariaceae sp. AK1471]